MAARNTADSRRFVYRQYEKEPDPYYIPTTRSGSVSTRTNTLPSVHEAPIVIRSADVVTPPTEVEAPARRVVVIRSSKHPQRNQGAVNLDDFRGSGSLNDSSRSIDGRKPIFLIRRPIISREPPRSPERHSPVNEPQKAIEYHPEFLETSFTTSLEYVRTPTPPSSPSQETIPSPDASRTPSPHQKSSRDAENPQPYIPYLRQPRSKRQIPSPVHTNSTHSILPANRTRSKRHSLSPPREDESEATEHKRDSLIYSLKPSDEPVNTSRPRPRTVRSSPREEEPEDTDRKPGFASFYSRKAIDEPVISPRHEEFEATDRKRGGLFYSIKSSNEPVTSPPVTHEYEEETVQHPPRLPETRARQKKSAGSQAKSVVLIRPEDQAVVVVENSNVKEESFRSTVKRPKSFKQTRFEDDINDDSTETLVKTSRWQRCLGCLSGYMCLILIICFFLILIGLAGVGVSTYFFVIDPTNNYVPKIVGIVIGGVLVITNLCFLCILLGCIGSRDGYYTYNRDGPHKGGRAFAMIPPSHPNAHLYIPRDYMRIVENSHPPPTTNDVHNRSSSMQPVSTIPYIRQDSIYKSNKSIDRYETKSKKKNITIEIPQRLVTGERMSPRTRERSLTNVVRNIGQVVEDAKKRYNGDVPNRVIVKVDKNTT